MLTGGGNLAWGVTGIELTATTTDCFLYNVGSSKYLTAGDWWGTHATIGNAGMDLDLTKVSDGIYTIGTRQEGSRFLSGVWMDGSSMNFTFNEVDAVNHYYTISYVDSETTYYLYSTGSTVEGSTTVDGNSHYWQIVTRSNFLNSLEGATSASPKDATGAIYNAEFFVLDYATKKSTNFPTTRSWQGTQLTDTWGYRANESGANGSNFCVEQAGKSFDNYQELTSLPNGVYQLKNQGFYRGDKPTYLYINDRKVALEKITSVYDAPSGYTGNDLQRSSYAIGIADRYHNTAPLALVLDGNIRIGVTSDGQSIDWSCFDNFTLSYLGMPSVTNNIDFTSNPVDMTSKITNPSFTSAYTTGWTLTGTAPNAYNSTYGTYEQYRRIGGLHQDISDLPNGVYKVTMQATWRDDNNPKLTQSSFTLFATSGSLTTKAYASAAPQNNFANTAKKMSEDASYGLIETYIIVSDGNLRIGYYESNGSTWPVFDNFTLTYYGTSTEAYALAHTQEANRVNEYLSTGYINDMPSSGLKTAINGVYTSNNSPSTVSEYISTTGVLNTLADNLGSYRADLIDACYVSAGKTGIVDVEYKGATADDNSTLSTAFSTHATTVSADISTASAATATLRDAIKTYLATAEPKNEGESFEITCLIENPSFSNNTITGWTRTYTGGSANTSFTNNEFYNNTFDFYQNMSGLANGSYQLSVQAFSRPGDNGNLSDTKRAYYDYTQGTNNVTAELYVNADASRVGNIYAYTGATTIKHNPGTWANDYECVVDGGTNYFVPNSMEGASKYFADENVYKTTVAALVEDGNLKIGFRDGTLTANQWTIFDNFRLYYYGSSKLVYYQQYLPQLKAEASADLSNGTYANILGGKEEDDFNDALEAVPATETQEAYKAVIDDIVEKQVAFRNAKTSYDAFTTAKVTDLFAKNTLNVGTGAFQYNETTNNTLYSACETAKDAIDNYTKNAPTTTAAVVQGLVDALTDATNDYNNQTLNSPDALKHYALLAKAGANIGKAVVAAAGTPDQIGNKTGYTFNTTNELTDGIEISFTQVSGNNYNISFTVDNETVYLTYGSLNGSEKNWAKQQIQGTLDGEKKGTFRIVGTTTEGSFKLYNTVDNNYIDCQDGGSLYTDTGIGNELFTLHEITDVAISEATTSAPAANPLANVTLTRTLTKDSWNTFCVPFNLSAAQIAASALNGATIKQFASSEDNVINLKAATSIVAGEPYLVKPSTTIENPTFNYVVVENTDGVVKGEGDYQFVGQVYNKSLATDGTVAYLSTSGSIKKLTSGGIKGLRAYFMIPVSGAPARIAFLDEDDTTTGITEMQTENTATNTKAYDLSGRRVEAMKKGIYIVNGKKVVK